MTEKSYLWTTGGAGDGSTTYTRSDWRVIAGILAAGSGFEGVAPGFLNECAGSVTGANTVAINTGGAVVDGKPYQNDASVSVNIPSAVGGGNTRIDRIVLRADWTAQTVRVTRVAGSDAASPTAPAITQTSETTYDIYLYQALVDTGGTVTLTDERDFAAGTDAIYRQGGSSTLWGESGTTTYRATNARMQVGTIEWTGGAASSGSIAITLPHAYQGSFITVASVHGSSDDEISFSILPNDGGTAFTIYWNDNGGNNHTSLIFMWITVGEN